MCLHYLFAFLIDSQLNILRTDDIQTLFIERATSCTSGFDQTTTINHEFAQKKARRKKCDINIIDVAHKNPNATRIYMTRQCHRRGEGELLNNKTSRNRKLQVIQRVNRNSRHASNERFSKEMNKEKDVKTVVVLSYIACR